MIDDKIIAFVTYIIEKGVASNLATENIKSSILQFDKYLYDQNLVDQQSSVRLHIIVNMLPDLIEIYKANGSEFANNFILKTLAQVKLISTSKPISNPSESYWNPVRQTMDSDEKSLSSFESSAVQSVNPYGIESQFVSSCGGHVMGRSSC